MEESGGVNKTQELDLFHQMIEKTTWFKLKIVDAKLEALQGLKIKKGAK